MFRLFVFLSVRNQRWLLSFHTGPEDPVVRSRPKELSRPANRLSIGIICGMQKENWAVD